MTLDAHSLQMAQGTAMALAKFHEGYVAPLERRILLIETITGIRLVRWVRYRLYLGMRWVIDKIWHPFYMRFSEAKPVEESEEGAGSPLDHLEDPTDAIYIDDDDVSAAVVHIKDPDPEHDGHRRILRLDD